MSISSNLFTAQIVDAFQKANLEKGTNLDEGTLKDLIIRCSTEYWKQEDMNSNRNLNALNKESQKVGLFSLKNKQIYWTSTVVRNENKIIEQIKRI